MYWTWNSQWTPLLKTKYFLCGLSFKAFVYLPVKLLGKKKKKLKMNRSIQKNKLSSVQKPKKIKIWLFLKQFKKSHSSC